MRKRTMALGATTAAAAAAIVVSASQPASADWVLATADLRNAAGAPIGKVVFVGSGKYADRVHVDLKLPSDAPGIAAFHGLHVHQVGKCEAPFTTAGGHWSLQAAPHGQHTGDLPSQLVMADGKASQRFETDRFDVTELFDADGSAVILHAGPDNFGNVPIGGGKYEDPNDWYNAPGGTAATGDAGGRYGCGVVQRR